MKKLYKNTLIQALFMVLMLYAKTGYSQCPDGHAAGTTAYDTTIRFAPGVTTTQIKFPKFDPQAAMLSCVKLIVTITGIVDTVAMQNYSGSPQTADFYYDRNDLMSGPGLTPNLSNSFNGHYGPYNLSGYDGVANSGGDFQSIPRDTVLKKVMTRTLTDSLEISQFYGSDSVVYDYNINVTTSAAITGGSSSTLVLTSALVNFRFEYCTCPITSLPLGLRNFSVSRTAGSTAQLRWDAATDNDNYLYEVEVSRDGKHFSQEAVVNKKYNISNPSYLHAYSTKNNQYGRYYFRIKQRWLNGYYRYTETKSVEFTNPLSSTISLYPNPSSGVVGIKFVSVKAGKFLVQISNAVGQIIITKEVLVAETDYKLITALKAGKYYVKIIDVATNASCVNQMVVQ
jgi:hypothetical protein